MILVQHGHRPPKLHGLNAHVVQGNLVQQIIVNLDGVIEAVKPPQHHRQINQRLRPPRQRPVKLLRLRTVLQSSFPYLAR